MAVACDPQTLVNGAACIQCAIPPGMQIPVLIYLAMQGAGISTDPDSIAKLVNDARCIECAVPKGMEMSVLIGIMCQFVE